MKTVLCSLCIVLLFCGVAFGDVVFQENFSGGSGQFTGFGTGGCDWQTPGANTTMIGYFGDALYAEITKSGCASPTYTKTIVSSEIDLSTYEDASLSFKHYFDQTGPVSQGQVSVSVDDGGSWTAVYTTNGDVSGEVKTVDISFADGEDSVLLRFQFSYWGGLLGSFWGVDDVTVSGDSTVDDDTVDDDTVDDDTTDDDTVDDDTVDDDTVDDDTVDDDTTDDDTGDDDTGDDDTVEPEGKIAYVYSVALSRGTDFKSFLEEEDYSVQLIQINDIDKTAVEDLSDYDVFLIDPDTNLEWDATRRAKMISSGRPIIGDGDALYVLADTEGYFAGATYAGVNDQDSLIPQTIGHPLWHFPYELGILDDETPVEILISPNTVRALSDDGSSPLGVQFLGLCEEYTGYSSLAVQDVHFAVWAFGVMGPTLYTDAGRQLLVNLIEYVQSEPVEVGYVYDADDADALVFETYLESVGYFVELFDVADLGAKTDLADIDLFIVDNNAGEGSWNAVNSAVLINSGKPIIANNLGVHVFDFTDLFLRGENMLELDATKALNPVDVTHDVWTTPYDLGLSGDDSLMVLGSDTAMLGLHDDGEAPGDVEFLAQHPAYLNHYPLAIEGGMYALWGPGARTPMAYSQAGRELLLNLIEYLEGSPVVDDDDTVDDDVTDDDTVDDDDVADDDDIDDDDDDDDDDDGCCGC